MKATHITGYTLVGYGGGKYPIPGRGGNCFSASTEDGPEYRIVNFGMENLEQLIKRGELSWPVEIEPISERHAIITDGRIPANWFSDFYCFTCTPKSLLRPQDLEEHNRRWEEVKDENGKVLYLRGRAK